VSLLIPAEGKRNGCPQPAHHHQCAIIEGTVLVHVELHRIGNRGRSGEAWMPLSSNGHGALGTWGQGLYIPHVGSALPEGDTGSTEAVIRIRP
jgi:hypothetical protein